MLPLVALAASTAAGMMQKEKEGEQGAQASAAQYNLSNSQRKNAQKALDGYGYQMYDSPYQSFYDQYINQYLTGNLSQGQEMGLQQAGKEAMSNINATMANRGGTLGGQMAMQQKTNADLAQQRANMIDQNINTGMNLAQNRDQFNLSQWLEQQNAGMRKKELMAQYAPGEDAATKERNLVEKMLDPGGFILK